MIGIYAGRFQPFHNGHLGAINHILGECDELYVLICSKVGDSPLDDRNPFAYEERKKMIELALGDLEWIPIHFKHIEDQENDSEWTKVIEQEMPKGEKVSFSNNPNTTKAFKANGYETRSIPTDIDTTATLIRKKIIRNEAWITLVPTPVWYYIQTIRGLN